MFIFAATNFLKMARKSNSDSGGFLFKTGLFAILAAIGFWVFNKFGGSKPDSDPMSTPPIGQTESVENPQPTVPEFIFPVSTTGVIVRHTYFTLSYAEDHEQAEWVAYELTRERLNRNWVERASSFRPDPDVRTESATPDDYRGSGYDRGHMAPAADMAFNELAMSETFLMSNMSPQLREFNGGVWRELEECTRDWARKYGKLYVVTGPVLSRPGIDQVGSNKVTVPQMYFKILLAPEQRQAIAFALPNKVSTHPIMEYAGTIDQVEELTGIDFFPKLLHGADEAIERSVERDAWPVDSRRYDRRVRQWNRR